MFDSTDLAATLVVHGTSATLFGAVGEPVPADAAMGIAEARARAVLNARTVRSDAAVGIAEAAPAPC